ncbi:hypothetical protein CC1G_00062 [Coprinopsis cinerea okayama7|uniref:Restriction of telomere capping protein 4 C-terminal domain-containing protein n=1 Tax=Coprinopsis cinerea (strain Okayama-7 / 130 / ATCC MYA-4618 / FGSC 9003) TaxID=240176 RepID=A8NWL7_COPC7|nr:hypothetical protein CC1G_00062 [Coprinopsis cinerea okayama7\|eukprot:XP_001836926.2 hypothetical protein CC1G_00062 [Coprinopsis cinerea okayama7\
MGVTWKPWAMLGLSEGSRRYRRFLDRLRKITIKHLNPTKRWSFQNHNACQVALTEIMEANPEIRWDKFDGPWLPKQLVIQYLDNATGYALRQAKKLQLEQSDSEELSELVASEDESDMEVPKKSSNKRRRRDEESEESDQETRPPLKRLRKPDGTTAATKSKTNSDKKSHSKRAEAKEKPKSAQPKPSKPMSNSTASATTTAVSKAGSKATPKSSAKSAKSTFRPSTTASKAGSDSASKSKSHSVSAATIAKSKSASKPADSLKALSAAIPKASEAAPPKIKIRIPRPRTDPTPAAPPAAHSRVLRSRSAKQLILPDSSESESDEDMPLSVIFMAKKQKVPAGDGKESKGMDDNGEGEGDEGEGEGSEGEGESSEGEGEGSEGEGEGSEGEGEGDEGEGEGDEGDGEGSEGDGEGSEGEGDGHGNEGSSGEGNEGGGDESEEKKGDGKDDDDDGINDGESEEDENALHPNVYKKLPKWCFSCRKAGIDHKFPDPIPDSILQLLSSRLRFLDQGRSVLMLECDICRELKFEEDTAEIIALFTDRGWPVDPDFSALPGRVIELYDEALKFITGEESIEDHFLYTALENLVPKHKGISILNKGRATQEVSAFMRAGYYGEPGTSVISSTIQHLFGNLPILKMYKANSPLLAHRFVQYFINAWVINRLIADDLGITELEALAVTEESAPNGFILHRNVDYDSFDRGIRHAVRRFEAAASGTASTGKARPRPMPMGSRK